MESEFKISARIPTSDDVKKSNIESAQKVVIVNVDMKIMDMANFMVKWAVATIPAAIMLLAIGLVVGGTITAIVKS